MLELRGNYLKDCSVNFCGSDSIELFMDNLRAMPDEWVYRHKPITYSLNKHGFRTESLADVDWSNSVVMFGCSNAMGIGLAVEDTIANRLEDLCGVRVVNLAIAGSAVDLNCWNSAYVFSKLPTPKAVVHIWTSLDRYTQIEGNRFDHQSANDSGYIIEHNWQDRSSLYVETDRAMWKSKNVPYHEFTFFPSTRDVLGVAFINTVDYARDVRLDRGRFTGHPGIDTAAIAARTMATILN